MAKPASFPLFLSVILLTLVNFLVRAVYQDPAQLLKTLVRNARYFSLPNTIGARHGLPLLKPDGIFMDATGEHKNSLANQKNFLNQNKVKEALGVENITYVSCSNRVYEAMKNDRMRNREVSIPALLEDGVKVLVYFGEYDLICNWLGNSRWVEAMEWSGQINYLAAPAAPFTVNGVEAGLLKGNGPLVFLKVHNAGHFVSMDQPKASLEMLQRWIQGNL